MICTYKSPVYTRIGNYTTSRKSVCVYSGKGNFDKILKTNKRMRYAIRKHKISKKLKNDSNKIILEELVSILDTIDDEVVNNMNKLNCEEILDYEFFKYIEDRDWP
jgi:hypothetical protein